MENFPFLCLVVPFEESPGLEYVKHSLGNFHLCLAARSFPVGYDMGIDQTLEEKRAFVGHAAFVFPAENVVGQRFLDKQALPGAAAVAET